MKKYIILIALLTALVQSANAVTPTQSTLGKIEESLYGFQYSNESNTERLNRIEKSVYGTTSNKSENERISKLNKDISADVIGQEIPPVEDTFSEYPEYFEEEMEEASEVSYPSIDELEKIVFNKVNKTDKINARLTKLEQKTFNQAYDKDDLSTRVERLQAKIRPQRFMDNKVAQSSNYFYDGDIEPADMNYHLDKYVPPGNFDYEYYNDKNSRLGDYYDTGLPHTARKPKNTSLSTIEKKIFKQNFNNDSNEHRLSRIEQAMFGTEFSNDDYETRMERVTSAYNAEKSAGKYDSNKFTQNLATAMQIGTLILMVLACIL